MATMIIIENMLAKMVANKVENTTRFAMTSNISKVLHCGAIIVILPCELTLILLSTPKIN